MKFVIPTFLALAVALVILPQEGASIKCYVCDNYSNGTECGHGKLSDKYLFDCPSQAPVNDPDAIHGAKYEICRKIITSIEFDVNDNKANERIMRKCGYLTSKYDNDCYYRGGFGGRQRVCSCKEDGCNGAFSQVANYGLIATIILAVFGYFTKF